MSLPRAGRAQFLILASLAIGAESGTAQRPAQRPAAEVHVWGGYSGFSDAGAAVGRNGGTGLRSAELAWWPASSVRLFGRFDNTLSFDNLTLLRAGTRIPTWSAGGLVNWGGHWTTVVTAGRRSLPGGVGETMLELEQVAYLNGGTALKAGAAGGWRADGIREWVAHAGVNLPVGAATRLEPVLFYSRSGLPGEAQWRALLAGERRIGGSLVAGAGVASGRISSATTALEGTPFDSYAKISVGIGGASRVHLLVRHERAPSAGPLTSVSLGLSLVAVRP